MTDELTYDKSDHVGVLTLNRPEVLNALTLSLLRSLRDALDAVNTAPDVRVLVNTGAESRAFSVGFDLSADEGGRMRTDLPRRGDVELRHVHAHLEPARAEHRGRRRLRPGRRLEPGPVLRRDGGF